MILRALETLVFADSCSRFAVFTDFRRRLRTLIRNLHFYLQNSLLFNSCFHGNQARTLHRLQCSDLRPCFRCLRTLGHPLESLAMPWASLWLAFGCPLGTHFTQISLPPTVNSCFFLSFFHLRASPKGPAKLPCGGQAQKS